MNARPHDTHLLDARGMASPESLIFVAKAARYLSRGTQVVVRGDQASSLHDLPVWAAWSGHEVTSVVPEPVGDDGGFVLTFVAHNGRPRGNAPPPA
jgi:TusA-related sulfurtransferase